MLAILQSLLHLLSIVAYEGDAITGQVFQMRKLRLKEVTQLDQIKHKVAKVRT